MNRLSLISTSVALCCFATVLPVLTSIYIANRDAERRERDDLQQFAEKAVIRAELVTYQSIAAIADMNAATGSPCSPARLATVARVIFNYRYVRDAGAYGGGRYLCSPLLGNVQTRNLSMAQPTWQSDDGYSIWLRQKDPLSDLREDIQIGRNGIYVSIDPQSFVDLIDPAQRPTAVIDTRANAILAVSYGADGDEMLRAWKLAGHVDNQEWIYAVDQSTSRPLGVIVKARRSSLLGNWAGLLAIWLSIGVAVGGTLGWVAFRRISKQLSFPSMLEWAIAHKTIDVHFQPIVRLSDKNCVGAEALVRWTLNGRNVSPQVFVAVAERCGLIQSLTDLVLEKTVEELASLLRARPTFYVSINVCSEDLRTQRFLEVVTARLEGKDISPAQIRIEATESSFIDAEATRQTIAAFRHAGHKINIDDFGTGYSSLSYLQSINFDILKIDKSFIDTIKQDSTPGIVVPHIIQMAHDLKVEIIAEGIELEAQVQYLLEKGVQFGQGWLFAKAMPTRELITWLDKNGSPQSFSG